VKVVCEIDFKELRKMFVSFKRAVSAGVPAFGGGNGLAVVKVLITGKFIDSLL
jgi:hypothetical protein